SVLHAESLDSPQVDTVKLIAGQHYSVTVGTTTVTADTRDALVAAINQSGIANIASAAALGSDSLTLTAKNTGTTFTTTAQSTDGSTPHAGGMTVSPNVFLDLYSNRAGSPFTATITVPTTGSLPNSVSSQTIQQASFAPEQQTDTFKYTVT